MLQAVLFDLDGTLVDEQTAAATAAAGWAADHAITDGDAAGRWRRISERHFARYERREVDFAAQRRARVRDFQGPDLGDAEADSLFADYLARYEAGWALFDDAVPALRRARAAGLVVAVLTNGEQAQQRAKLEAVDLTDEVDLLLCSSELPAAKPDPRAFAAAVGRTGVEAAGTLMVGDSPGTDVAGALRAGLQAVLLDRGGAHPATPYRRVLSLAGLTFDQP